MSYQTGYDRVGPVAVANGADSASIEGDVTSQAGRAALVVTVTATRNVEIFAEFGKAADSYGSLPHSVSELINAESGHAVTDSGTKVLVIPLNPALPKFEVYATNGTGSSATVTIDVGVRAHS